VSADRCENEVMVGGDISRLSDVVCGSGHDVQFCQDCGIYVCLGCRRKRFSCLAEGHNLTQSAEVA
jgi:hypothetical protein